MQSYIPSLSPSNDNIFSINVIRNFSPLTSNLINPSPPPPLSQPAPRKNTQHKREPSHTTSPISTINPNGQPRTGAGNEALGRDGFDGGKFPHTGAPSYRSAFLPSATGLRRLSMFVQFRSSMCNQATQPQQQYSLPPNIPEEQESP